MDVKKKLIMNFQPNANLDGKSEVYINARFDAVCEQLPAEKVIAAPSRADGVRHVQADAADARSRMINRLKNGYKTLNVKG
jgi:hypothetical protein